jgi:hypothetical protein
MPYNPYEVNRVMAQTNNSLLGSGELKLRQKNLAMEEQAFKVSSMQRMLGLTYQYESIGIPKEKYWPVLQKMAGGLLDNMEPGVMEMSNKGEPILLYKDEMSGDEIRGIMNPQNGEIDVTRFKNPDAERTSISTATQAVNAKTPEERDRALEILDLAHSRTLATDSSTGERISRTWTGKLEGTGIEDKPHIGTEEVDKIAQWRSIKDRTKKLAKIFDAGYVGPVRARMFNAAQRVMDLKQADRTRFIAATQDLKTTYGHLMFGGAYTATEEARIDAQMPDETLPPTAYVAKLVEFADKADMEIKSKLNEFKAQGYHVGETKTSKDKAPKSNDYPLSELPDPSLYQSKKAEDEDGNQYISDGKTWHRIK